MENLEHKLNNENPPSDPNERVYSAIMWGGLFGMLGHFGDYLIAPGASKVLHFANTYLGDAYSSMSWWVTTIGASAAGAITSSKLDRYATNSGIYTERWFSAFKQYFKK